MNIQELKSLMSDLDNPNSSAFDETRKKLIEHASEKEVLDEFVNILCFGNQNVRIKLVDILADIHTEQAFELLVYALHDSHSQVRDRVIDNLKESGDVSHILFFIEAVLSYEKGSKLKARKQALSFIREYKKEKEREYFLPLIEKYLDMHTDLDLTIRGKLLSVLARHGTLDGIDNLIDATRYGNFDVKEYSIEKLNKILNDGTREKIQHALYEALQQEYHPDIRLLLKKALYPENENKSIFSSIQSSSDWFAEAILYFRKLGFYQKYSNLSKDKLVKKIRSLQKYELGDKLTHNNQLLLVLAKDKERVWYCDSELCWDQQYVKFIKEWRNISCKVFAPKNITEIRNTEKVQISFRYKKQQFEIYVNNFGEWIDLHIFEEINEIIKDSKYQFWNIVTDTQEACVICLTAKQKNYLEKDLGFKFELSGRYIPPPKLW